MHGGVGQSLQDVWTALSVATLIKCIDDEDESMLGGARKSADELKEEGVLHRPWHQVWVITKASCHKAAKRGKNYSKFVDESRQDVSGFAQTPIIPPAEKCASEVISLVEDRADRMC